MLFARDFKCDSSGNSLVQSFFTDLFKLLIFLQAEEIMASVKEQETISHHGFLAGVG